MNSFKQKRSFLLLACLYIAAPYVSLSAVTAVTDLDARVLRLEQWLKAVLYHQPGTIDNAVRTIGSWSIDELNTLAIDQGVLIQLTQNLTQLTTTTRAFFTLAAPRGIPYSAAQWRRLKLLACAAAGAVGDRACVELGATMDLDPELMQSQIERLAHEYADMPMTSSAGARSCIPTSRSRILSGRSGVRLVGLHLMDCSCEHSTDSRTTWSRRLRIG